MQTINRGPSVTPRFCRWLAVLTVFFCLSLTSALGQDNCEDLRQLLNPTPFGDAASFPEGARVLPFCDYLLLLQSDSVLQIAPTILQQQKDDAALVDAANEHFIDEYLAAHPELTDLATLVNRQPAPGPDIQPYGNGDWLLNFSSGNNVVTLGRSSLLNHVAQSIRFSQDRDGQWQMYTDLYNALPPGIFDPALGIDLPTPDSLATASIGEIQRALAKMADQSPLIQAMQPAGPPMSFLGCNFETGASSLFGDQGFKNPTEPSVKACSVHDGFGLYATFDFPNKPYLTCVKNQGMRGTCHTFATVSSTEMMIARGSGDYVNLSEQDVMEHYKLGLWGENPSWYGDGGGTSAVVNDIIAHGYYFPYESGWDYNPSFSRVTLPNGFFEKSCELPYPNGKPCSNTSSQAPLVCGLDPDSGNWYCSLEDAGIAGSSHTITSGGGSFWMAPPYNGLATDLIRLNVALNRGVTIGLTVTKNFMALNNSKFGGYLQFSQEDLKNPKGGHVVHVVGYVSNEDIRQAIPDPGVPQAASHGYFIIKNSWNSCWGDGGYAYLPWEYVVSQTNEAAVISAVQ